MLRIHTQTMIKGGVTGPYFSSLRAPHHICKTVNSATSCDVAV